MPRIEVAKSYVGYCDVTQEKENNIRVTYPDGSCEIVSADISAYKRYFDKIGTLLGSIKKINGAHMLFICPYVTLHNHGEYSLLDGMSKAKNIVKKLNGDDAIYTSVYALTDHGLPSGLPSFDATISDGNLDFISGVEVYAESLDGKKKNHHLVLLVKNDIGYKNLSHLCTEAQKNFYRHANVTFELLKKHHEGLICSSACLAGEFASNIMKGDYASAQKFIEEYKGLFGEDFYIEVQNHGIRDEQIVTEKAIQLAKENGVKVIATTDSHYINEEDKYAHEVLLAIGTKHTINDPKRFRFDGTGYHILNADEFYNLFDRHPEVISNGFEIAKKCQYHFRKRKIEMPYFEIPEGFTEQEYFDHLAKEGFKKRFEGTPHLTDPVYIERLNYELSIIHQMQFEGYILIVYDFIAWAKKQGIAVGPGRGSAAGSLVAYCLTITDLDPIQFGLLFERFLNPERVSMPDIDIDLSDERRQEVIDYVTQKYGQDHVSRIVAFGTEAAKRVVLDVGRVLDMPLAEATAIAKAIPEDPHMTLDIALQTPEFKMLYDSRPDVKNAIDIGRKIEGVCRNISQHACGVVIAKNPIADNIPEVLVEDTNGNKAYTAAFNKDEVEANGCIKFDFLGLRNMSILKNASDSLGLDYEKIPLFDPSVYEYIASGDTDGIFQIESPGMKSLISDMFSDIKEKNAACKTQKDKDKLGLECFERLGAAIALYRPGPMDCIPDYLLGMKNPQKIRYDCKEVKPILSTTYGVICYQEQVQQICRDLAGYSYGRADLIRRGMAKKKPEIIASEREVFLHGNKSAYEEGKDKDYVPGCIQNGISERVAVTMWNKMAKFAEYAFNRAHSACYAVISARTAWLKYYHPVEFWTETLNSISTNQEKIKKYLKSVIDSGMRVLPPDINKSELRFTSDAGAIRIGLQSLRNIGAASVGLVHERKENGEFENYESFLVRCLPSKKVIESLAYSGAFDTMGLTRREVIMNMDAATAFVKRQKDRQKKADADNVAGQISMFELFETDIPNERKYDTFHLEHMSEYTSQYKLKQEYMYVGMYVSAHPLDEHEYLCRYNLSSIESILSDASCSDSALTRKKYRVAGIIKECEWKTSKSGSRMFVGTIEDKTASMRFIVFDGAIERLGFDIGILQDDQIVLMEGYAKTDDFGTQLTANIVSGVSDVEANLSSVTFSCDLQHAQGIAKAAFDCQSGKLCVVIEVENADGTSQKWLIDRQTGKASKYNSMYIVDSRYVHIDINEINKVKELSKNYYIN